MTIQHACSQRDGLEVKQEVDTCAKEASQLQRCTQCHLYKIGKIALALVSCFFFSIFFLWLSGWIEKTGTENYGHARRKCQAWNILKCWECKMQWWDIPRPGPCPIHESFHPVNVEGFKSLCMKSFFRSSAALRFTDLYLARAARHRCLSFAAYASIGTGRQLQHELFELHLINVNKPCLPNPNSNLHLNSSPSFWWAKPSNIERSMS